MIDARIPAARDAVSGRRLLLALGIWFVLSVVAGVLTTMILNMVARTWSTSGGLIVLIIAEVYLALLAALLLTLGGTTGLRDRLGFRFTSARDLLLALFVWILFLTAGALVYTMLIPILGSPQDIALQVFHGSTDIDRLSSANPLSLGLIVVRACLLAPLCEELLFRGALFDWLRHHLPPTLTILLTAALFAVAHVSLLLLPLTFLLGIATGWVRERTGSTLTTFVLHAATTTLMLTIAFVLVAQHVVK